MQRHFSASLPRCHDAFGIYPASDIGGPANHTTSGNTASVPSAPGSGSHSTKRRSTCAERNAAPSSAPQPRCPAPPLRSNPASASARHSSASGSRPGTSRQRQLCDVMLEIVKAGRTPHRHSSRPSTSRTVASLGLPIALTPITGEVMQSIESAARDKISSWPLMIDVDDASSTGDNAVRPLGGSAASTPRSSPRMRAHQAFFGPLHKELKQQADAMERIHHTTTSRDGSSVQRSIAPDRVRSNDAEVLSRCAAMLEVLRRGTSHHPIDAAPGQDMHRRQHLPSLSATTVVTSSPLPRVLEEFLTATLPKTALSQWNAFEEKKLPTHVDEDYRSVLDDTVAKLQHVDDATAHRLKVELSAMRAAEIEWQACRERHTAEFRALEAIAAENEGTLDALERRFHILFERHAQEHILSQEAKRRIELVELLLRNEKLLRSEVRGLAAHLDNVRTRKQTLVANKQAEYQDALDAEAETKEEVRCLLSEKQWLAERHQSVSLRQTEEERRTAEIHDEIAQIKSKMSKDRDVPIGPELTPRPQWLDRMETIAACRLPTPKQPAPARGMPSGVDDDEADLSGGSGDGDEEGPPIAYTRQRDRRQDTVVMLGMDAPGRSLSQVPQHSTRKRSGGMSLMGGLRVGSLFTTAIDVISAGRWMKQSGVRTKVPNDASSFREFVLRMRERLAVQSEMLRLAQDLTQQFRRAHQAQLDTAANVCSLSVATAGGGLSKQAPVQVPPIGPAGVSVPVPNWSHHELTQRCLALWGAVLEQVQSKGDHRLVHPEQTSVPALLALLHRHRHSFGGLNRLAVSTTRASTVVAEPAPFPPQRGGGVTESTRASAHKHHPSLHPSIAAASPMVAGVTEEPFGKAVYGEIELSQLHYVLGRQSEAYAAATAVYEPSAATNGAEGATNSSANRRLSVAAPMGARSRRRHDGGTGRALGDAVRTIQSLGVDPETGERLSRVAVVTALTLHHFKSHVKLLEDLGTFFSNLEEALAAAAHHTGGGGVVSSSSARDCDQTVPTSRFIAAIKVVCSRMALGCAAMSELSSAVYAASVGGGVPSMLGALVVQAGPLGRRSEVPEDDNGSMTPQLASQKVRTQSSNMPRMAQLGDPSLTVHGGWSSMVALSDRSNGAPHGSPLPLPQGSTAHASPTKHRHSARAQTLHATQRDGSVTNVGVVGGIRGEAHPSPSSASPSLPAYQRLFTLSEQWGPLLDAALKHLQLQQHQLQCWFAKILIENAYPSEVQPWVYFIPARVLETKLPCALMNADDPIFPDMEALMEYYYRHPMPVVKEEKGLRHRAGAPRRLSALVHSPSEIDSAAWRVHVASLMETIIHACDASTGADHFNVKSPTSSVGRAAKPNAHALAFMDNDSFDSGGDSVRSGSVPSPKGSVRLGTPRHSKTDAGSAGAPPSATQPQLPAPPPPPATPLGLYLRFAQREAETLGKHRAHVDHYVWKAPSQRPLPGDDMYSVEDVFLHLCGLPLRQYFYQETKW